MKNSDNAKENGRRLGRVITQWKSMKKSEELDAILRNLELLKEGKEQSVIRPLTLYLDVLESFEKSQEEGKAYPLMLRRAEEIYDDIFFLGEETPDYEKNAAVFLALAKGDGLAIQGFYDKTFFATFRDKWNYITFVRLLTDSEKHARLLFPMIKEYALTVREYHIDEMGYLSDLIRVFKHLASTSPSGRDAILEEEISNCRRCNGVYDIDPVRLAQVEKNVNEASAIIDCGRDMLELLEQKTKNLERLTDELEGRAKEIRRITETFLETKSRNAKNELEASVKAYEDSQKKTVFLEKEFFLKQVFADAEAELAKYQTATKAITAKAATELNGLSRDADRVIRRLENASQNDERIKKVLEKTGQEEALLEMVDKLSALKEVSLPEVQEMHPPIAPPGRRPPRPIPGVNPLLSREVPFADRFALVMKEKERRMARGELFHEMFDDVLTAVMENVNPYLIGPSGCGKTYMVRQIGELLNLECADIGYVNEEYDILGYVTATGDYNESVFYRLYKYGGIAFCDELDNGNGKATVKLNSFLSNQEDSYYFFPGGERVNRHANFRVIAAGNTNGNGADVNYNTREKIEESVQQRMIPIFVDYDNRVEREILRDQPDWYEFGCAFRMATDQWEEACGMPAQGIFTTRDAYRIRQYLSNGSFSKEKIMNYEFVQTKEPEYLGYLAEALAKIIRKDSEGYELYSLFCRQAEAVRKKRKRNP